LGHNKFLCVINKSDKLAKKYVYLPPPKKSTELFRQDKAMTMSTFGNKIQTVSEFTSSIRGLLETEYPFVTLTGEVSNLRQPYSGHIYFTLKDSQAQIRAVLFKNQQRYLNNLPANGQQVICRGRLSVYEARGEYQIIVDFIEESGAGLLHANFTALKHKLDNEGLFDSKNKKTLPLFPDKIYLITSPQSAAVYDFLGVAEKRFSQVPIEIVPVRVQGDSAPTEMIQALDLCWQRSQINKEDPADLVIVLCRGGGSLEDLWAFNNEELARTIAATEIPVVSAVGHDIDFTIADFVADHRAATPTAAARDILPDQQDVAVSLSKTKRQLHSLINQKINQLQYHLHYLRQGLGDPGSTLDHYRLRLDNNQLIIARTINSIIQSRKKQHNLATNILRQQEPTRKLHYQRQHLQELASLLKRGMERLLDTRKNSLTKTTTLLQALGPHEVLERGYAIVHRNEEIIKNSSQTQTDDELTITLSKGSLTTRVSQVNS